MFTKYHSGLMVEFRFTPEGFDPLTTDWEKLQDLVSNSFIFSSHAWSRLWWDHFGKDDELLLGAMTAADEVVGIAPLARDGNTARRGVARFIGSADVCDYLDFIIAPGREHAFFDILLDNLAASGIDLLELGPVRPDSTVATTLAPLALDRGLKVNSIQEDISLDFDLPPTWDQYLENLTGKQRHEIRRKIRRLDEMGEVHFRTVLNPNRDDMGLFLELFRTSRQAKSMFLTPPMEAFFRAAAATAADRGWLRLNILELASRPVATTLNFEFKNNTYLYNSGFSPEFSSLSVGLISKVLSIKQSIETDRNKFDFLKGDEEYKHLLGGQKIPIYRYSVQLAV